MRIWETIYLYNLKVEVVASDKPMVCRHREGDYFLVVGEDIIFPENNSFSMYALSAILPLLPANSGSCIQMIGCYPTA